MSNKNRDADKKPLMYIVQPNYSETRSSMQEIVIKRKVKTAPPEERKKPETAEKQHEESLKKDIQQEKDAVQQQEAQQHEETLQQQEARKHEETLQQQEAQQHEETAQHQEAQQQEPAQQQEETEDRQKSEQEPAAEVKQSEKEPEAVHNAEAEEKQTPPRRVKKPMSKMSIIEKIDFLTKLPHNMPRALCLIEANGKTYRGVIVGRRNNSVLLRTTGNGAPTELVIDDITSLHPLGF
ncbi:CotO family spore coat protein [Bacillus atrophaeus]|uniref:CotO family spore coat protein n=1 Tax=Bacillus atrophaeus TaxID=1452 RepID=UPI002E1DDBE0|nr:CotO family spore coat protein [Bacillus atrophaeus]MED1029797.1 CotO family spore coat protein [Bacillus atrophaeus]MED1131261.1 CotO family spore coat protein [Bacillus atrophaeus]